MRDAFGAARVTKGRRAIADVVARLDTAFTAEDLIERVRSHAPGSASPATVYRSVLAMLETGYIERVGGRDGAALYSRCDCTAHHHHVVCERCGATAQVSCPLPLPDEAPVADYIVTRHEVTLYGMCPRCRHDDVAPPAGGGS